MTTFRCPAVPRRVPRRAPHVWCPAWIRSIRRVITTRLGGPPARSARAGHLGRTISDPCQKADAHAATSGLTRARGAVPGRSGRGSAKQAVPC